MNASLLIPAVLFGIIALIIFIFAAVKTGKQEGEGQGGEEMIKKVYVYLVLFATLMMTIGGSVAVFMSLADIVAPQPYYQSFEDYQDRQLNRRVPEQESQDEPQLSREELREEYDRVVEEHQHRQVREASNSIIKSAGWIVVPLPIFIYYKRRLGQE